MPNSLLYLLSTLIWGSTWLVITYQFGEVPATASVAYRFLLAGGAILAWCAARGIGVRVSRQQLGWMALQGVFMFGISYMLVYEAERHISSGLVAVLNSSIVIFNLIGIRLAFGRAIEKKSAVGAVMGFVGIALVFWPELTSFHGASSLPGIAFGLGAAILASCGTVVAQRNRDANLPLLPTIGYGMITGGILALLVTLVRDGHLAFDLRPSYLGSLAYLAFFGSIVAFAAYLTLLGRIGGARAGYVTVAIPIVALILSAQFEHFDWHPLTFVGIGCAALGNIVMMADVRQLLGRLGIMRRTNPAVSG
jgi:drug/metabolite transporter (DMT)-like permease